MMQRMKGENMADDAKQAVATELLPQRWICLVAMVVAIFFMQFSLIIMPGIAGTIIPEMGMDPALFGMLANMPYLAGVLFGVIMGNVGDRVGIKKLMTISIVVFIVGAFWRWQSVGSYAMLMVSSLVMGFGLAVLNANSTKGIRLWFPGKALGPAMGLYIAGASLGAGAALYAGPMLGTSTSLLVSAISAVVTFVVWILCYKTHPLENTQASGVEKGTFSAILKNKDVWIVSFMIFFVFGNSTTFQTYMVAGLNNAAAATGIDGTQTVALLSAFSTVFVALASIVGPAFVAKFSNMRVGMIVICIIEGLCTVFVLYVPFGPLTWVVMIIAGLGLGTMLAMGKTVPALLPDIDPRNLGAVGGLQSTLQNLGGWVIAGYIIAPIAQAAVPAVGIDPLSGPIYGLGTYQAIYIGAMICSLLVALCYLLLSKNVSFKNAAASGEE